MARKKKNSGNAWVWIGALIAIVALYVYNSSKTNGDAKEDQTAVESIETQKYEKADVEAANAQLELPAFTDDDGQLLRRVAYTVLYDKDMRLPRWVAWHLTADHTDGPYNRNGLKFAEDYDVPEPRATNDDYRNSGYDRGHLCPSGDNKWSEKAQLQSFLYTNCCPQLHSLNAGDWNELEQRCRLWAEWFGDIYIVSGPVLSKGMKHKTIGKHKVVVPEAFFKVVLCANKFGPMAIGFVCNNETGDKPLVDYVKTVDEVERMTGLDFFPALPDDVENKIEAEASLNDWAKPAVAYDCKGKGR